MNNILTRGFSLHLLLQVVIIAFMLRAVYFVEDAGDRRPQHSGSVRSEIERAVQMLVREGFRSGIVHLDKSGIVYPDRSGRPVEDPAESLFLCGSGDRVRTLREQGLCAVGYSNADNPQEGFPGAAYVVQEPDLVDADSYVKMYEREAGLPWTILRTPRCLVREFIPEDLDALYGLYDEEARRFLEPPSEDRSHEREVLRAYIDRIYPLYGFGHWAVLAESHGVCGNDTAGSSAGRNDTAGSAACGNDTAGSAACGNDTAESAACRNDTAGSAASSNDAAAAGTAAGRLPQWNTLIGRVGFSALTAGQEQEALSLSVRAGIPVGGGRQENRNGAETEQAAQPGAGRQEHPAAGEKAGPEDSGIDADFGFLIARDRRGTGIAEEVCRALLQYGFTSLGFSRVRADAQTDNIRSCRLLEKLGFVYVGTVSGSRVYICDAESMR